MVARRLSGTASDEWAELAAGTGALYRAAYRHSGASFLVDLSKIPTHLLLLEGLPDALDLGGLKRELARRHLASPRLW